MYSITDEPIYNYTINTNKEYDFLKHEYDPQKKYCNKFMMNLENRLVKNDTRNQRVNMLRILCKKYDSL